MDSISLVTCSEDEEITKRRKIIVGYHVVMSVVLTLWWHRRYLVKEINQNLGDTRKIYLNRLYYGNDRVCKEQLRLNKHVFSCLCQKLREDGLLRETRFVLIEEAVAMFLYVLAHGLKNRVVGHNFMPSGETVSRHFNIVLRAILRLGKYYLIQPKMELEGVEDEKWEWFEDCLGALDGTYIPVTVPLINQGRYRNRKGFNATNVLGVCSRDMRFTYILPGWEGSAADSRVLRDALARPDPLVVPNGKYYLVDAGYTNCPGFLAPYRGVRYHLNEWSSFRNNPQTYKELFNLRHSTARNVIERAFGLLKKRWAILRSPSFFDLKTQVAIISACGILHNLIRIEQPNDPLLLEVDRDLVSQSIQGNVDDLEDNGGHDVDGHNVTSTTNDRIRRVQTTNEWAQKRKALAQAMFLEYQNRHNRNNP